ncbi:hypothetical protein [Phaeobacter sp. Ay1a-4a]|uniref:hypothetical protein n=1 Tax=Phaeobacter sp. Ay1a-4a TaxID=3112439 RepID=UPI003A86D622
MRVIEVDAIPSGFELDDFKRSVHMMDDEAENDPALGLVLESAEAAVATATGRPVTPRLVEFIVVRGHWSRWWFPVLPVQELTGLAVDDGAGGRLDQPLGGAWLQQAHDEPQLVIGRSWVGRSVQGDLLRIQARVGGADVSTFPRLRQAVFLLAKEWLDAGVSIEGETVPQLSFGVRLLIKQARYIRPFEVA